MVWVRGDDAVLVNLDKVKFLFIRVEDYEVPKYKIIYCVDGCEEYNCLIISKNKEFIDNAFKQLELHLKPIVFEEEEDVD